MTAPGDTRDEVIFLTTSRDVVGGAEESILGILKFYPTASLRPVLVAPPGGEMEQRARSMGVTYRPWSPPRIPLGMRPQKWFVRPVRVKQALKSLHAALPQNGEALITSHTMEAHIVAAAHARRTRRPVVWHIRDLIPQRGVRATFRLAAPAGLVRPAFVSAATREHFYGSATGPVMSDGLDLERFSGRASPDPERPVFMYAGQLLPRKGVDWLLKSWARVHDRYPRAVLRIAGSGDEAYTARLREAAAPAGDSVRFLGWRQDLADLFLDCTGLVLPSRDEALGMVLLEGMASGVPPITTPEGGMTEYVRHEDTGYLVPYGDETRMAETLESILADPAAAQAVADRGYALARREQDAATQARRQAAFHAEVFQGS